MKKRIMVCKYFGNGVERGVHKYPSIEKYQALVVYGHIGLCDIYVNETLFITVKKDGIEVSDNITEDMLKYHFDAGRICCLKDILNDTISNNKPKHVLDMAKLFMHARLNSFGSEAQLITGLLVNDMSWG